MGVGLLVMTPVARPVWAHVNTLRTIQFPWRVFPVTLVCAAGISALLAESVHASVRPILRVIGIGVLLQMVIVCVGAAGSLALIGKPLHLPYPISHRAPVYTSVSRRDTYDIAHKDSSVPEYIPAGATRAGWHPDANRYGLVSSRPLTFTGALHDGERRSLGPLEMSINRAGDLTLTGQLDKPEDVTLPLLFYPDERLTGPSGGDVHMDSRTGLARVNLAAGHVSAVMTHSAPVPGLVLGKWLGYVGLLGLSALLLAALAAERTKSIARTDTVHLVDRQQSRRSIDR